jgi:hypothetical protein
LIGSLGGEDSPGWIADLILQVGLFQNFENAVERIVQIPVVLAINGVTPFAVIQ